MPVLARARVLTTTDYSQLESYCVAQGLAVKAAKRLKREGLIVKRGTGALAANPLIAIAKEARAQALKLAIEFGLTPASRARVRAGSEAPDVDLTDSGVRNAEAFLFGRPTLKLVSTAPATPVPTSQPPLKD